jgi:hypothetical protein
MNGYQGRLQAVKNAHLAAHRSGVKAHAAFTEAMHKTVDNIGVHLGVPTQVSNANDTTHQSADTTAPGEVTQGFKASGMNATQLQRLEKSLGAPTVFSQVQGIVNQRPNQALAKSSDGGWKALPERGQQERVLSTFEQRQRDSKQ